MGLPEAGLNLAHAVIYLATAPKSNPRSWPGWCGRRAMCAGARPVPSRAVRSVHPYQRNKLKEGGGYRYPHNDPSGFIAQEYRPPEIAGEPARPTAGSTTGPRRTATRPIDRRLREWWGDAPYDPETW